MTNKFNKGQEVYFISFKVVDDKFIHSVSNGKIQLVDKIQFIDTPYDDIFVCYFIKSDGKLCSCGEENVFLTQKEAEERLKELGNE